MRVRFRAQSQKKYFGSDIYPYLCLYKLPIFIFIHSIPIYPYPYFRSIIQVLTNPHWHPHCSRIFFMVFFYGVFSSNAFQFSFTRNVVEKRMCSAEWWLNLVNDSYCGLKYLREFFQITTVFSFFLNLLFNYCCIYFKTRLSTNKKIQPPLQNLSLCFLDAKTYE